MGLTHSRANLKKIIAAKVICSGEKILTNLVCGHSPTHLPSLLRGVEATLPQGANNPPMLVGSAQKVSAPCPTNTIVTVQYKNETRVIRRTFTTLL